MKNWGYIIVVFLPPCVICKTRLFKEYNEKIKVTDRTTHERLAFPGRGYGWWPPSWKTVCASLFICGSSVLVSRDEWGSDMEHWIQPECKVLASDSGFCLNSETPQKVSCPSLLPLFIENVQVHGLNISGWLHLVTQPGFAVWMTPQYLSSRRYIMHLFQWFIIWWQSACCWSNRRF